MPLRAPSDGHLRLLPDRRPSARRAKRQRLGLVNASVDLSFAVNIAMYLRWSSGVYCGGDGGDALGKEHRFSNLRARPRKALQSQRLRDDGLTRVTNGGCLSTQPTVA